MNVVTTYPNFAKKHALNAYVNPRDTIEYARAHGDLEDYKAPKGIIFIYQRSVLEMACAFVVSYLMDAEEWQPHVRHEATTNGLNRVFGVALRTLL